MATTTGMVGGGYYDDNSEGQRIALSAFLPWLEKAVEDLDERCLTFVPFLGVLDIGSSEGGNAIYAMKRIINHLPVGLTKPVHIIFSDLPTNDFNHLFTNLFPEGKKIFPGKKIFTSAIAGTAFGNLAPSKSLYIATTFNAIGFLNEKPKAKLPHYVLPHKPGPLAPREGVFITASEQEPFRVQSANDLLSFYNARAEELVSGGKLLVQVFGRNDEVSTTNGIYDVLSDALLDCIEDGIFSYEVYENIVFPIYCRTIGELVEPIKKNEYLASVFRIEKAESREVDVPFNLELKANGDIKKWADHYTRFLRAFSEPMLALALPDELDKPKILNQIYERIEKKLIFDNSRYQFRYISIAVLLSRN